MDKIRVSRQAPPLPPLPQGKPLVVITLDALPSINEVLYLRPIAKKDEPCRRNFILSERTLGYNIGVDVVAPALGINVYTRNLVGKYRGRVIHEKRRQLARYITQERIFCFARIVRKASKSKPNQGDRIRDVYNPFIKAFIDGLTDAGLWPDDNELYHQDFWIHYEGTANVASASLEFYEV